ncbi:hypothetical protein M0L20_13660 [Spirosoma sp. RP8]|uniref:Uncharacterized protein n=1 Tax=Spirosoma liriopis TaxID=2937440 RepID=A0ABT0HL69_9BACT|nr:hypothetical protein [Spirosoma liriopis]MCK8492909.1 hypothetical protein [Spirosoma liriopis]
MKSFRVLGSILFSLILVASMIAPTEVQAVVPPSVHDFFMGPDGVTLGMATVSLTSMSRKERQKSNLGGILKLYMYGASDFTSDFPMEADVAEGLLVPTTLPVKTGVTAAVVTFDLDTCRVKGDQKGKIGYQNCSHSGECKMAGYEAGQLAAIKKVLNEGGVVIAVYKNGTRELLGTSWQPLEFEVATDSGAKGDDPLQIDFKFKGDGYPFLPPILPTAMTLALPA